MTNFERLYPFGITPISVLLLLVVSGMLVLSGGRSQQGIVLEMWTFGPTHYDEYRARLPAFEAAHPGVKVDLKFAEFRSMHDRLLAAFLSGLGVPDLAEVEISHSGKFFKGAEDEVQFIDLRERLGRGGWLGRVVRSRFEPYSYFGRIYGVPHDLHPAVLIYRDDLWRQYGIDLSTIETWDQFVAAGQKVMAAQGSNPQHYPIALYQSGEFNDFMILLAEHGGSVFDKEGNLTLDSPAAAETMQFYSDLFNRYQIAFAKYTTGPPMYAALKDGVIMSMMSPDWDVGNIKKFVPEGEGRWRARPLPRFAAGGFRTASLGGTMIGITRACRHQDLAWELLQFLYFDRASLVKRYESTGILPPLRDVWADPVFDQPDPYFGGQRIGKLYQELAGELPAVHLGPYWAETSELVKNAIYSCTAGRASPAEALRSIAAEVRKQMKEDAALSAP